MALVRDLYQGRDMARIISFVMTIFTLVPAVAPLIEAGRVFARNRVAVASTLAQVPRPASLFCAFVLGPADLFPDV